jgi:hypothetical protein
MAACKLSMEDWFRWSAYDEVNDRQDNDDKTTK